MSVETAITTLANAIDHNTGPSKIFLSFRRADSTTVSGQIFDRLTNYYHRSATVLNDVGRIPASTLLRRHVHALLDGVAVLLVVVGPNWLEMQNRNGVRRLEEPDDPVRVVIEDAFTRSIPVQLVLVRGAQPPSVERLPPSIRALADLTDREPLHFTDASTFNADMRKLYAVLNRELAAQRDPSTRTALETAEPSEQRKAILREAQRNNERLQQPPYHDVRLHTLGEVMWILREAGWHPAVAVATRLAPDLRGVKLTGVNLTGVRLIGVNLSGAQLDRANLREADLARADLTGATLDDANLQHANLQDARLDDARLGGASLAGATLSLATLVNAELNETDLTGAHLDSATLDAVDLSHTKLGEADFTSCKLRGATLNDLDLSAGNLKQADLTGANLHNVQLVEANLEGALLTEARLEKADLRHANLKNASLVRAELTDATLAGADLTAANLSEATLRGAHLQEAKLPRAVLLAAHLESAHLDDAHLWDADLTNAHLTGAHLSDARLGGAKLGGATLTDAHLAGASFIGARLHAANLERADLRGADLSRAELQDAKLAGAHLDRADLSGCALDGAHFDGVEALTGCVLDLDTRLDHVWWGGVAPRSGRRSRASDTAKGTRRGERIRALNQEAIVNHQLAEKMRSLGLLSKASDYRLEEQRMRRKELFWRRKPAAWLFSWILHLVAGYGEKPLRTLGWYLAVVFGFAAAYYGLIRSVYTQFTHLSWQQALVVSFGSFHGRGFFPSTVTLGGPLADLGTVEAIIGLFIELIFIATFTRRFLGN